MLSVWSLRTPFYITFVFAVGTVAAVMLTDLTVGMIFAIDTVMMTTAAANRSRRIRIQVINQWRLINRDDELLDERGAIEVLFRVIAEDCFGSDGHDYLA